METEALAQRRYSLQSRTCRLRSVISHGKQQIGFGSVCCMAAVRARGCLPTDRTRHVKEAGVLVPMEMEPRLKFYSHLSEPRTGFQKPGVMLRSLRGFVVAHALLRSSNAARLVTDAHRALLECFPAMRSQTRPGAPAVSEFPRVWPPARGSFWTIYGRNTDVIKYSFQTGSGH